MRLLRIIRFISCFMALLSIAEAAYAQGVDEAGQFPIKGCVRYIYQTAYKAVVENGVICKGEQVLLDADTIHFKSDGTLDRSTNYTGEKDYSQDSIAYQYDNTGNCIKMIVYYPNKQLKESRTLVYNDQGLLKLCIIRSTLDEVVDAISYSYDPYGKLAIKIYNRKDGEMMQQRFAYDPAGNWIVRVDFNEYDPVLYVERKIEYYP